MSDDTVLYQYIGGDSVTDGIPGVPLRDLTRVDIDELPEHARISVAASPLYRAARAPGRKAGPAEVKGISDD